jgi:surface antigen
MVNLGLSLARDFVMTTRAILIATAAMAGLAAQQNAEARTPLMIDAAAPSPSALRAASEHAALAPAAFERPPVDQFEPNAVLADPHAGLQCVPFARREAGVEIYGDANTWWSQAKAEHYKRGHSPKEGAVLVLRGYADPAHGHVAVVREVVGERLIIVDHANWLNNGEITRDVPVRDVSPRGDWSEVQVWHVPGAQWGARTYRAQGFILPQAPAIEARASAQPPTS